ncbi:MAG: hypothetical protein Q9217_001598 [Psora testacea]
MASPKRYIIFFGDGSHETQSLLSSILRASKEDTLLSLFLSRVSSVLKEECTRLSQTDREGLPNFQDLDNLIRKTGDDRRPHPALHPTELVLSQLAQFIGSYERYPTQAYPDSNEDIILGLCFGELSAAAISLARNLVELLPIAVEAVRQAFRGGVLINATANELEPQNIPEESWSLAVPRESGLADGDRIEQICKDLEIPKRKHAYITALSAKTVVVGGPPSTLKGLAGKLKSSPDVSYKGYPHRVHVYAPYHAPHLYTEKQIESMIDGASSRIDTHELPHKRRTLIGAFTGRHYSAPSRRDLMKQVYHDILSEPIIWGNVVNGIVECVAESGIMDWIVRPFGPTPAAQSMISTLKADAKVDVCIDESFDVGRILDPSSKRTPLAIVGMAGRFPDAVNHDALWKVLEQGLDCHKVIPTDRFDAEKHLSKARYGCFMDAPGSFDARFFNLSPREALQTDPGQRLALVTAYEALEMAGYVPNRTPATNIDRIGTFYGQTSDEYKEQNMAQDVGTYFIPGGIRAFGPGRINHYFKFGGPAYSVDTACSSSLVALNMACNSVWSHECDTALAGGMNIVCGAANYAGLSEGHFLSETGGCKTYDNDADGYCRGEAVGSVVVKRLDAAEVDNDNILAVILSTATNYPDNSVSITHPYGPAQETLYRHVLNQAGIEPFDVGYIEMHGTGTQAGDAVEMSSVSNVFAPDSPRRPREQPLFVGAAKANFGHGEAASGITALIKTLLVLREQKIPPHVGIKGDINRTFPNLKERNLFIPRESTALPAPAQRVGTRNGDRTVRRRVLVNNFSAAGGNTAVVMEEGGTKRRDESHKDSRQDSRQDYVICISAKSKTALTNNIKNLIQYLEDHPQTSLSDLSYTTTARRIHYPIRSSVTASSIEQLQHRLTAELKNEDRKAAGSCSIALAFTGQGALYTSLGRELYETCGQFRADLNRFDDITNDHGFTSFLPVIDGKVNSLDDLRPVQTQLAITAVQIALFRLWLSFGIHPAAVIGHSLGEYAALYAAGVISLSDTLYLVGIRASILESNCELKTHAMLAIHATLDAAKAALVATFNELEVACLNGPEDIVLSGAVHTIEDAAKKLKSHNIKSTILNVPFAFHSSQVDPILEPYKNVAQTIQFSKPKVPIISPLLRTVIKEEGVVNPSYLARHAREPVDFSSALQQCGAEGLDNAHRLWVEIGPHPICLAMIKSSLGTTLRGTATLRNNEAPWTTTSKSLSFLYQAGLDLAWSEYHRDHGSSHNLLTLPSYAFDNKNYWIEYKNNWLLNKSSAPDTASVSKTGPATTTVQRLVSTDKRGDKISLVFETDLSDPAMHSTIIGHLSVYADMALTVADYIREKYKIDPPATAMNVIGMEIPKPIIVPHSRPEKPQLLRIEALAEMKTGKVEVEYGTYSSETKQTDKGAKCTIKYGDSQSWLDAWARSSYLVKKRIAALERGVQEGTTHKIFRGLAYKLFAGLVHYESKYQGMREVLLDSPELESTALLELYSKNDSGRFYCSPYWVDSFAHLAGFVMNANDTADLQKAVHISHGWGSMVFAADIDPTKPYRVHVKMQPLGKSMVAGDMAIFDHEERMVGFIGDLKFQQVPRSLLDSMLSSSAPQPVLKRPAPALKPARTAKAVPSAAPENASSRPSQGGQLNTMLDVIAAEVGVPANELSNEDSFAQLGVDSLLTLTILSKFREGMQLEIPKTLFEECQTVGDLRNRYQGSQGSNESSDDDCNTGASTPQTSRGRTPDLIDQSKTVDLGDTLSTVRSIIAQLIGVEVDELVETDDLASLGVDSLMSLSILGALREKVGLTLPPNSISGNTSLKAFEDTLSPSPKAPTQEKTPAPKEEPAKPLGPLKPKPKSPLSFLLQGNPKTASKRVMLFPDGSGSATSYEKLPTIGPDVCIFGLNSPFLKGSEEYSTTVQGVVARWVQEIRYRQAHGPYILAGWSAGGYYAYEATKQLVEAGEKVEKLMLIDSPCRLIYEAIPLNVLDYLADKGLMGTGLKATPQWLVDHFASTIHAVENYIPTPMDSSKAPKTYIIWASEGVVEDLDSEKTNLDLNIKVSRFLLQHKKDYGPQGWERLLPADRMECATMPGTHFTIVQRPNCDSLSRLIADVTEEDESKRKQKWIHA